MKYTLSFPENYVKPALPGRDIWTATLRSGKYKQGSSNLRQGEYYCCLGVLCEIQNRPCRKREGCDVYHYDNSGSGLDHVNPLFPVFSSLGYFPNDVALRLQHEPGEHEGDGVAITLAGCNDAVLTFNQIADIIEAVWENA